MEQRIEQYKDSATFGYTEIRDTLVNDIGTILDGYAAVECGLIDEVGGIKEALGYLKRINGEA